VISAAGQRERHRFKRVIAPSKGPDAVTRKEAERIAYETILCRLDRVTLYPGSLMTVREFALGAFAARIRAKKPAGAAHYRYLLDRHVLPEFGGLRLRDITLDRVQALLDRKLAAGYSVQTAIHIRNCISALFRHAKRRQVFTGDLPTVGVELPAGQHPERPSLTWDQARALIAAIDSPLYRLLVLFLATTGLRIGEALGLRWSDLDFEQETITVRRHYARKRGCGDTRAIDDRYGTTKTPTSRRRVPLLPALAVHLRMLVEHQTCQLAQVSRSEHKVGPDPPVFAGRTGRPLDAHNVLRRFLKPAAVALGLPWVTWHSLRHTAASLADQAGLTDTERQRVLGHASDRMTRLYSHADLERVRERLNEVAERLLEPEQMRFLQ
jgi:integrase